MMIVVIGDGHLLSGAVRRLSGIALVRATTATDARAVLLRERIALVVLDPAGFRDDVFGDLLVRIAACGAPLLIMSDMGRNACVRIVQAAQVLPIDTLSVGSEREVDAIHRLLSAGGRQTTVALLLSMIALQLASVPEAIIQGVVRLFGGTLRCQTVVEFANAIGVEVPTLRRRMRASGLRSPIRLMNCFRVAVAHTEMSEHDAMPLNTVAERIGWPVRTMRSRFHELLGCSPRVALRTLPRSAVASRLFHEVTVAADT